MIATRTKGARPANPTRERTVDLTARLVSRPLLARGGGAGTRLSTPTICLRRPARISSSVGSTVLVRVHFLSTFSVCGRRGRMCVHDTLYSDHMPAKAGEDLLVGRFNRVGAVHVHRHISGLRRT